MSISYLLSREYGSGTIESESGTKLDVLEMIHGGRSYQLSGGGCYIELRHADSEV